MKMSRLGCEFYWNLLNFWAPNYQDQTGGLTSYKNYWQIHGISFVYSGIFFVYYDILWTWFLCFMRFRRMRRIARLTTTELRRRLAPEARLVLAGPYANNGYTLMLVM